MAAWFWLRANPASSAGGHLFLFAAKKEPKNRRCSVRAENLLPLFLRFAPCWANVRNALTATQRTRAVKRCHRLKFCRKSKISERRWDHKRKRTRPFEKGLAKTFVPPPLRGGDSMADGRLERQSAAVQSIFAFGLPRLIFYGKALAKSPSAQKDFCAGSKSFCPTFFKKWARRFCQKSTFSSSSRARA